MKILIDNGHGLMIAGKRSPDGQFREPYYNREIAKRVVADLVDRGYDAELLVPEDDDIALAERVRRVNSVCFLLGKSNVILVSIHVNAASDGTKWMNASGWSVYTCKGRTPQISLQIACASQLLRISQEGESGLICQTVIWTGRRTFIFSESRSAQLS